MTDEALGTILVVEDDADIRACVVQFLADAGFAPVAARNGREALRLLRDREVVPVAILLDLTMPVMDGWQFRAEQLEDPALAAIPVIVLTAVEQEGTCSDALIRKPFEVDHLLRSIARVRRRGPDASEWKDAP